MTSEEWLLTEGNQYVSVGEFRRNDSGKVEFVGESGNTLSVPIWAITNMLEGYASGKSRVRL